VHKYLDIKENISIYITYHPTETINGTPLPECLWIKITEQAKDIFFLVDHWKNAIMLWPVTDNLYKIYFIYKRKSILCLSPNIKFNILDATHKANQWAFENMQLKNASILYACEHNTATQNQVDFMYDLYGFKKETDLNPAAVCIQIDALLFEKQWNRIKEKVLPHPDLIDNIGNY